MKADKTVDVTVNYCGEDRVDKVGYSVDLQRGRVLFGYCDMHGYMTHMSYSLDHSKKFTWADWLFEMDKYDPDSTNFGTPFYFDAGNNGRPLYIAIAELERAMKELGLVSKEINI